MSFSWVRARLLPRVAGLSVMLVLTAALAPSAGALSQEDVQRAKAKVQALQREIADQKKELAVLAGRLAIQGERVLAAQDLLEDTKARLLAIHKDQAEAQARYDELQEQLAGRARSIYISGPGSNIDLVLGADSLSELSARLAYVNALSQHDGDLAVEVRNLQNRLAADEEREEELKAQQADQLADLEAVERELQAGLDQQQALLDQIERKEALAERNARKVSKRYAAQVAALGKAGKGIFKYCPVGASGRVLTNSFGAPRYAGGFHLHAGVDIMATYGTPIYAPFDGTASNASNGLGGLSVGVRAASGAGYVYNAHLSRMGQLGPVSAGDVIGYVGTSGDAQGTSPHDHFEWHPSVLPSQWESSPYGYSVIGDAVNPYPLLVGLC